MRKVKLEFVCFKALLVQPKLLCGNAVRGTALRDTPKLYIYKASDHYICQMVTGIVRPLSRIS